MKKWYLLAFAKVRAFFGFSSSEAHGFIIMMTLMLIVGILPWFIRCLPIQSSPVVDISEQRKLDSLVEVLNQVPTEFPQKDHQKETEISHPKLFTFDPNRATEQELMKLGLPKFLTERIVKYREKGGRFKKPSDFEKIYGLRTADYQRLLPYINIPSEEIPPSHQTIEKSHSPTPNHAEARNTPISLDINTTDSTQLVKVKGVGPVLATRILKYRNKLGGFVSMAQINEVYGLDSVVVQNIKNQYFVSNGFSPKPVLINQSDYKTLAGHPYIGGKLAGQLLNYKKQHGNFHQLSDLEKVHALEPTKLGKLAPYLSFSE